MSTDSKRARAYVASVGGDFARILQETSFPAAYSHTAAIVEFELCLHGLPPREDLPIGPKEDFPRTGEDAKAALPLEEKFILRRGEGGVFEGVGKVEKVEARLVFEGELHPALNIEGHARAGDGLLPHDVHRRVFAEKIVEIDRHARPRKIEGDAGRGSEEEGFRKAELHGEKPAGRGLAEDAVRFELCRPFEAVDHAELHAPHREHGGAVG